MKGFPDAKPFNCPVMALAVQFENLVAALDRADVVDNDSRETDRIHAAMDRISGKASWLSPQSFEGAVFQVMLATRLPDMIANGRDKKIRKAAEAEFKRLVYRSLDRLDASGYGTFPLTRRELLPEKHDPGADGRRSR
jgi:hypothetical protein